MKDCLRPKRSVMIAYLLQSVLIYILIFIVPTVMAFALSFLNLQA